MKPRFKESDLQKSQITYLASRKALARDLVYCAIPNDSAMFATNGKMNYGKWASLKAMGLVPGAPDLIVWMKGKVFHIENKVKPRKPTAEQEAFGDALRALGHHYVVLTAETPGDAVNQLEVLLS